MLSKPACHIPVMVPQVAAHGHTPKRMRARSIGLQVLRVELDTLGRRWEVTPGSLLLEIPLCKGRELSASFRADPGVAYVLVPYPGWVLQVPEDVC